LTQQELLEVLSLYQEKDWMDWATFIVSILTPIITLVSVIIAWRATKVSKRATELNLKMYKEQKEESEKSHLPVFEVQTLILSSDTVRVNLINRNSKTISISNIAYEGSIDAFEKKRPNEDELKMQFLGDFKDNDQIKVWLYYTTQSHNYYASEIVFRIVERAVVIESHKITN